MRIGLKKTLTLTVVVLLIQLISPAYFMFAETLEEQLNNQVGPSQQYNTMLSPVYLKTTTVEEYVSPASGDLSVTQTDYVLEGRGMDLEIKRIYKSGVSNVREMKVKYQNGAWVDYVEHSATTSSFYEDRYNLGIGMRFSFPQMEVNENGDGTKHLFLHTETGDTYSMGYPLLLDGVKTYFPDEQTVIDAKIQHSKDFSSGQTDGTSEYVLFRNTGTKTYFAADGRLLGIVDKFGNTQTFEYQTLKYAVDGKNIEKKLMSKIIDTTGREVTFEYKEDHSFKVKPITETYYSKEESYKESQNPNTTDSGDLEGKFQVIVRLPDGNKIVYDKSAALVSDTKSVIRTRLQRVYDVDGVPKYHYWYEQPSLGFTYTNGSKYSVYNRYENLVQIDDVKKNKLNRYTYDTFKKRLSDGSMEYQKVFKKQVLEKTGFDKTKKDFLDRFTTVENSSVSYKYTNEPDGYGTDGYNSDSAAYLENTYRYTTEMTYSNGSKETVEYNGKHETVQKIESGKDHKRITTTEHDDMKLIKKRLVEEFDIKAGLETGSKVEKIENFRYDKYGNLTNYTDVIAERDDEGMPIDQRYVEVYSYDYDKFHALESKTWYSSLDQMNQIQFDLNDLGEVIKEIKINGNDEKDWVYKDYAYDSYGNVLKETTSSENISYETNYEYGTDRKGVDHKGAYLTAKYTNVDGQQSRYEYAYDKNTGNIIELKDPNGNITLTQYDAFNRLVKRIRPDKSEQNYAYIENGYSNFVIAYIDPENIKTEFVYNVRGMLLERRQLINGVWTTLDSTSYDKMGNKTSDTDSKGNKVRFTYNSDNRLIKKERLDNKAIIKSVQTYDYGIGTTPDYALRLKVTDEEGGITVQQYDKAQRLVKRTESPDQNIFYDTYYEYDFDGKIIKRIDPNGAESRFEYDSLGRKTLDVSPMKQSVKTVYDAIGNTLETKGPGKLQVQYEYDALGRAVKVTRRLTGHDDFTETVMSYDLNGNMLSSVVSRQIDGNMVTSEKAQYVYDSLNRVDIENTYIDENRKSKTDYDYDANSNITKKTVFTEEGGSLNIVYDYEYDCLGNKTLEEAKGPNGGHYKTEYSYDFEGNLLVKKDMLANGNKTTEYAYDHRNQVVKVTESGIGSQARITELRYDKAGREVAKLYKRDGRDVSQYKDYDDMGRLISSTDGLGNKTLYAYDSVSQVVKRVMPNYAHLGIENAPGFTFEYDLIGRQTKEMLFDGKNSTVTRYVAYNDRGLASMKADGEGFNENSPALSFGEKYEYDENGNLTSYTSAQMTYDNISNGTNNVSATFVYDGSSRKLSETDANSNTTNYEYYGDGNVKSVTDALNHSMSYKYDLTGGRRVEETNKNGYTRVRELNIFGKPVKKINPDGCASTLEYDAFGRVTKKTDEEGFTTEYSYDVFGNVLSEKTFVEKNDDGIIYREIKRTYNEQNQIKLEETFEIVASSTGKTLSSKTMDDLKTYEYDLHGNLVKLTGPNGKEKKNEYDKNGQIVTEKKKIGDGAPASQPYAVTRYEHDLAGNVIKKHRVISMTDVDQSELGSVKFDNEYYSSIWSTESFEYNTANKLVLKTDAYGNETAIDYDYNGMVTKKSLPEGRFTEYEYDAVGNLVKEESASGAQKTYIYDAMNRVTDETRLLNDLETATVRYAYDAEGNQTHVENAEGGSDSLLNAIVKEFDGMNRVLRILDPYGEVLTAYAYHKNSRVKKTVNGLNYKDNVENSPGDMYEYNGLGQVVKKTDAKGSSEYFEYDVLGGLKTYTDKRGYATKYENYPDGKVKSITSPDGGVVSYSYNLLGNVVSKTAQDGTVWTYSYTTAALPKKLYDDKGNEVEFIYNLNGQAVEKKMANGVSSYYEYNGLGEVTVEKLPLNLDGSNNTVYLVKTTTYNLAGRVQHVSLQDSKKQFESRESDFVYDLSGRLIKQTGSGGTDVRFEYDKNDNMIVRKSLQNDGLFNKETFKYDLNNRIKESAKWISSDAIETNVEIEQGNGLSKLVKSFTYNNAGLVETETNENGYVMYYDYDVLGQLITLSRMINGEMVSVSTAYDASGNKTSVTDAKGAATTFKYDGLNRPVEQVDALGAVTETEYDLSSNVIRVTNDLDQSVFYKYDSKNRLVETKNTNKQIILKLAYDSVGNVISQTDAKGYVTTFKYDFAGRNTQTLLPEAKAVNASYSELITYSPHGDVLSKTDALGAVTSYEYDPAGRLLKVVDATGNEVRYTYSRNGLKETMTDGKGKITNYAYAEFGLLTSVTNPNGDTELRKYSALGTVSVMTDKNGNDTVFTYNDAGQLLRKKASDGTFAAYEYDRNGNVEKMTDSTGITTYDYDVLNRVIEKWKNNKKTLSYTYDEVGNIETVTDLAGNATEYVYDELNRLKKVKRGSGLLGSKVTTYTYDANGNRESTLLPNGIKTTYVYNMDNRLLQVVNKTATGTSLSEYLYTYDLTGQIVEEQNDLGTIQFVYDAAGRIYQVNAPGRTEEYSYDEAGNRKMLVEGYVSEKKSSYVDSATGENISYSKKQSVYIYDSAGRLMTLLEKMYNGEGTVVLEKQTSYLYDKNGNTIRTQSSYTRPYSRDQYQSTTGHVSGDGATNNLSMLIENLTSEFDGFNRLVSQDKTSDGKRVYVAYAYDGTGLRVQKTVKSSENDYKPEIRNFYYDRQYVILETDENGKTQTSYTRGINYISKTNENGADRYYVMNGHGDVVQLTDTTARVVNRYEYDTFGGIDLAIESETNAIRYAGEYYDEQTGQYYLRARYYDPHLGRFISEDSYWGEDSNPLSLNRYTYAHNNPIKYVDPSGHKARSQSAIIKGMKEKAERDLERAKKSGNDAGVKNAQARINGLSKYEAGKKQYDDAKKLKKKAHRDRDNAKTNQERKYAEERIVGLNKYLDSNMTKYEWFKPEDKIEVNKLLDSKKDWDRSKPGYVDAIELYSGFARAYGYANKNDTNLVEALQRRLTSLDNVYSKPLEVFVESEIEEFGDDATKTQVTNTTNEKSPSVSGGTGKGSNGTVPSGSISVSTSMNITKPGYEDDAIMTILHGLEGQENADVYSERGVIEGNGNDGFEFLKKLGVYNEDSVYFTREVSTDFTLLGEIVENSNSSEHDLPYLLKLYEMAQDDDGQINDLVNIAKVEVPYDNPEQVDVIVSEVKEKSYLTISGKLDDFLNAASETAAGHSEAGLVIAAGINVVGYINGKISRGVFSEPGDYEMRVNSINTNNVLNEVGMHPHYQTIVYARQSETGSYRTYAELYDGWNSALFNFHYQNYYRKSDGTLGRKY